MVVFAGRQQSGAPLTNDVRRYAITDDGQWDPPVLDPTPGVSGSDWPDEREFPALTDAKTGPYYLFGGKAASVTLGDVWQLRRYDTDLAESYQWTKLTNISPMPKCKA